MSDTAARVRSPRLRSQRLSGAPAGSAVEVVEHLLAIQAQDPRGMRLAVRARSTGLAASDLDRALTEERSVVVATLNRGTLHLVTAADFWWLRDLMMPRLATMNRRRLAEEGVSATQAARGVSVALAALRDEGPLSRDQLRVRLDDGAHAFVDATTWLDRPAPIARDAALAELARRYLRSHGPADERDLAAWSGLPLGDVRIGLAAAGARRASRARTLPPPRLLGPFDPVLHGWASREWLVGQDDAQVVTSNGIFRPTALVDGRVVATWKLSNDRLDIAPREPLDDDTLAALHADGAAVRRYLSS